MRNTARDKDGGFFYCFQRTDTGSAVGENAAFKFGLDKAASDDCVVDARLVMHETGSCRAVIGKHLMSKYIPDITRYDHVANQMLAPSRTAVTCPCNVNHQEYYREDAWTVRLIRPTMTSIQKRLQALKEQAQTSVASDCAACEEKDANISTLKRKLQEAEDNLVDCLSYAEAIAQV
ncbi:hypothetical protein BC832DRAFT_403422 [Gaertneriomyces semiglobifer]|nr:hypothetical protein BC832DRAFT_403422 [Gaertneriomyces semiglobifer]